MDIANELISYLFTYGKLSLPGLGKFELNKKPSKRVAHESKIYPPSVSVKFKEDTGLKKSGLSRILNKKFDLGKSNAEKKIRKAGTGILNQLLNLKEASIPNFGKFIINSNDKIEFELDKMLEKSIALNYPAVTICYFNAEREAAVAKTQEIHPAERVEKSEKIGWFFPFMALVATSLLFACLISCFLRKTSKDSALDPKNQSQVIIAVPDSSKARQETDSAAVISEETGIRPIGIDSTPQPTDQPDSISETIVNINENFDQVSTMPLDEILQISLKKKKNYKEACIIVVGSFLRRDLLDNMLEKLRKYNYDIYVEKYGRFYRTCIIYACEERNMKDFLSELRMKIDKKAWILKY